MSTEAWFIKLLKIVSNQKSAGDKSEVEYRGLRIHAAPNLHDDCIALVKEISTPEGAHVLDIGAGEGAFSQRLVGHGDC